MPAARHRIEAPFADGAGLLAGAGVECDIAGPWALAVEYSRVRATFEQTVASTDAQEVDFKKLSNELEVGQERLGAWRRPGMHGVVLLYPSWSGPIRPYGGAGLGYAAMRADFGWNWRCSADPLAITTDRDQPNVEEVRRNLADTASRGTALFRKNMHVFVYVGETLRGRDPTCPGTAASPCRRGRRCRPRAWPRWVRC